MVSIGPGAFPRTVSSVRKFQAARARWRRCYLRRLRTRELKLHSKLNDESVMLYAFDMLETDGRRA